MAGQGLAVASQCLPFKFTQATEQAGFGLNPGPILGDHLLPRSMDADLEWVAPFRRPTDIDIVRLINFDYGCHDCFLLH